MDTSGLLDFRQEPIPIDDFDPLEFLTSDFAFPEDSTTQNQQANPINKPTEAEQEAAERKRQQRRATQARYNQRQKQNRSKLEQKFNDVAKEIEDLRLEQQKHTYYNQTLMKIQEYKASIYDWTRSITTRTATAITSILPHEIQRAISLQKPASLSYLPNPSDWQLRLFCRYVSYDRLLQYREGIFLEYKQLLAEYNASSNQEERDKVESIMQLRTTLRYRSADMMLQERPDLGIKLIFSCLLPPGEPTDAIPNINPILYPLLTEFHATGEQRAVLLPVLLQCRQQLRDVDKEFISTKEQLSEVTLVQDYRSCSSMSAHAKNYLKVMEKVINLAGLPRKKARCLLHLWSTIMETFTAVQHATVFTRCYPFLPDSLQVCELILGAYEVTADVVAAGQRAPIVDSHPVLVLQGNAS